MPSVADPRQRAGKGEEIYDRKYRSDFEHNHAEMYVLIDVDTEKAHIAASVTEVFDKAKDDAPGGNFHLIHVGHAGVFRVSYTSDAAPSWV